jgi:hypothetical protein
MHELLGIVLGAVIGGGVAVIRPARLRAIVLLPALLAAGVLTSAINGELGSGFWGVFVAVDTLLVALGFVLGLALVPRLARARN